MRRWTVTALAGTAIVFATLGAPGQASAQSAQSASAQQASAQQREIPQIAEEKLTVYAQAHAEIGAARDEAHDQFALPANKTEEAQARLRESLDERIAEILEAHALTSEEYATITFVISIDEEQRERFEEILDALTEEESG